MSATASPNDSSQSPVQFNAENISEKLDIQSGPADALTSLSGWDELRAGIENNHDWASIDGVGPATEEALNNADVDELPTGGPASPEIDDDSLSDETEDGDSGADNNEDEDSEEDDEVEEDGEGEEDDAADADDSSNEDSSDNHLNEPVTKEEASGSLFEVSHSPSIFKASIELSRLEAVFSTVGCLVDEAKLRVGEDRIAVRAVDPANVAMIDLDMHSRAFDSYQATTGVLGINVSRVIDVLSVGNDSDTVELELNVETRKLNIAVDGLEYTIALIDPDSIRQEPDLPDLELTTSIEMNSKVFSQAVDAGDMVSDHIGIGFEVGGPGARESDYAEFYANGDTDDVDFDLTARDDVDTIDVSQDGESIFSLDYLKQFEKMVPKDETVELEVGDEFPAKIFFNVADSHAAVEGMLAPRIKSD